MPQTQLLQTMLASDAKNVPHCFADVAHISSKTKCCNKTVTYKVTFHIYAWLSKSQKSQWSIRKVSKQMLFLIPVTKQWELHNTV